MTLVVRMTMVTIIDKRRPAHLPQKPAVDFHAGERQQQKDPEFRNSLQHRPEPVPAERGPAAPAAKRVQKKDGPSRMPATSGPITGG